MWLSWEDKYHVRFAGNEQKIAIGESTSYIQQSLDFVAGGNSSTFIWAEVSTILTVDDYEIYELDSNGFEVKKLEVANGDFEQEMPVEKVTNLTAERTFDGIKLSWTLPGGTNVGDREIGANIYENGVMIGNIKGTELTLSGVELGEHTYEVRAINIFGYEAEGVSVTANSTTDIIATGFDIYDGLESNETLGNTVDTVGGTLPAYTVMAHVSNPSDVDSDVMIAYAMYDEDGGLVDIKLSTANVSAKAKDAKVSVEYECDGTRLPANVSYAKIFLWNMTENLKPMALSKTLPREN